VTIAGVESFAGKLAVVTGGGSGMGRELVRQLAAAGCSVAACDVNPQTVEQTAALAGAVTAPGVRVTGHRCDVSDESQVLRFRDELLAEHASDHVDLVFSNAGIGGGGSFINDSREQWERTFAVDWWGVYYCARAFLPLLIASGDGVLVNTSSLNGLWASLGPGMPNNAYSTAKFAVRGFTEALRQEMLVAGHPVQVTCVHPGGIKTAVARNATVSDGEDAQTLAEFYDKYLLLHSPEMAAQTIVDGVGKRRARVLIGWEAKALDVLARVGGSSYQRVIAAAVARFFPLANKRAR